MAKNHAPSLLFSVIVHLAAGLILYITYQAATSFTKTKRKETLMCVSLSTYEPQEVQKREPVKDKVVQKILPKKIIQKKTQKKIIRKIIKKPEPKVVQKTVVAKKSITKVPTTTNTKTIKKEDKAAEQEIVSAQETNATQKPQKESPQKEYVDNHLQNIQELLQDNLYYPRRARKRGIVGTVVVHFEIARNGEVTQVEALSSPSEILSRAAVKTIEDLSGKFPKPNEKLFLKIPIVYKLSN